MVGGVKEEESMSSEDKGEKEFIEEEKIGLGETKELAGGENDEGGERGVKRT